MTKPTQSTTPAWQAHIVTLFPEAYPGLLGLSLAGRALKEGLWDFTTTDLRDFGAGAHRAVDERPAGGGAGMILRADIAANALDAASEARPDLPILALSARGARLTQARVQALAQGAGAIFLAPRFEGVDERLFQARPIEEISIGDYILASGDMACLVVLDAIIRLLPGVMGEPHSAMDESFSAGLLEYPHYTKPTIWEARTIPEVLTSGDHKKIADWRRAQAEALTRARRPDLWEIYEKQREKN